MYTFFKTLTDFHGLRLLGPMILQAMQAYLDLCYSTFNIIDHIPLLIYASVLMM